MGTQERGAKAHLVQQFGLLKGIVEAIIRYLVRAPLQFKHYLLKTSRLPTS